MNTNLLHIIRNLSVSWLSDAVYTTQLSKILVPIVTTESLVYRGSHRLSKVNMTTLVIVTRRRYSLSRDIDFPKRKKRNLPSFIKRLLQNSNLIRLVPERLINVNRKLITFCRRMELNHVSRCIQS